MTEKKSTAKIPASGRGRKTISAEEKKARKEERDLKRALEIIKKHGLKLEGAPHKESKSVKSTQAPISTPKKTSIPKDMYSYKYIMNTNKAGAIHLGDIGMFIEVDVEGKKLIRFTENDFNKSREIGTQIAKGNLIDVTNEYLEFLEAGNRAENFRLWFQTPGVTIEHMNAYTHIPKVREDMIGQSDSVIVDEDDLSRVPNTSDMKEHMAATQRHMRPGADVNSIESVLDAVDSNNNPIADENIADRSNPANFVDPRMRMAKNMPKSPEVYRMRSGNLALSNQKELYPYTEDHHELTMIQENAQVPYTHMPKNANINQPIYEAIPQHMSQEIPMVSREEAQALYQQKMQEVQSKVSSNEPSFSQNAKQLLNQ